MTSITVTIEDIIQATGAELQGDVASEITGVNTLEDASATEIAFLDNLKYQEKLKTTNAAVVILKSQFQADSPTAVLISGNPYLAYAKVCELFAPKPIVNIGKHPTAVVGEQCQIADSAAIAANVVIGNNVVIGDNAVILPGVVIGDNCKIAANSQIKSNTTLYADVEIGEDCIIHSGVVLGSAGFGNANDKGRWHTIPHLGKVIIGNDVEIGANTTIDRGALKNTVIEDNVRIDNLVQIAHNVHIGAHTAIAACAGIAGSAKIGKYCMIGGAACVNGHTKLVDKTIILGMGMVTHSIDKPGIYGSGTGIMQRKDWQKSVVIFRQLPQLASQLQRLTKPSKLGKFLGGLLCKKS